MSLRIIFVLLFTLSAVSISRPHYTMLTANRCINCHYDGNGSGIRNDLGWYSQNSNSLINPKSIGIKGLYDLLESNDIYKDKVSVGFDTRIQSAKLGGPRGAERETFLMQATPYLRIQPYKWLNIYGKYNFSDKTYPGQSNYGYEIKIQPNWKYPYLRAGFIQPNIGQRYDDHTTMIKNATGLFWSSPMIPPDYHEYGFEIGYESLKWLGVYAGIYSSDNLSDISFLGNQGQQFYLADSDELSGNIKIKVNKSFLRNTYNIELGNSYYFNNYFNLYNIYLNLGWTDKLALLSEVSVSNRNNFQDTDNYLAELSYKLLNPLILYFRYENANTVITNSDENSSFKAQQAVIGASVILLPYIEIRPEYRIFDRSNYPDYSAQYAVQLHLFY